MRLRIFGLMCGATLLAACSPGSEQPVANAIDAAPAATVPSGPQMTTPAALEPVSAVPATPAVDASRQSTVPVPTTPMGLRGWTGDWFGPEGLRLSIEADGPGRVRINLKDSLDSTAQYVGHVNSDSISFERRGTTETLRRGVGTETGFSFLRSRQDCLIVRTNQEGYCRRDVAQNSSALTPWLGRWQGPEGLFMDVEPGASSNQVRLTVKDNLDSQDRYSGRFDGSAIRFERRGRTETIRRGSGPETGFSFLRSRQDCLIVLSGREGYCRP